eukprot:g18994.t1
MFQSKLRRWGLLTGIVALSDLLLGVRSATGPFLSPPRVRSETCYPPDRIPDAELRDAFCSPSRASGANASLLTYPQHFCRTQIGVSVSSAFPFRRRVEVAAAAGRLGIAAPRRRGDTDQLLAKTPSATAAAARPTTTPSGAAGRARRRSPPAPAPESEDALFAPHFPEFLRSAPARPAGARPEVDVDTAPPSTRPGPAWFESAADFRVRTSRTLTTLKLHYDLIKHFRFRGARNETALELGCSTGDTTRILVKLFRQVICVEKRTQMTKTVIPPYPNLVKLNFDLYAADGGGTWAFHLGSTPVHFVFVDALHDYAAVLFDIRAVLAKIPCCVHTLAFHDYYFPGVMQAVRDSHLVDFFGERWKHLGFGADGGVWEWQEGVRRRWHEGTCDDVAGGSAGGVRGKRSAEKTEEENRWSRSATGLGDEDDDTTAQNRSRKLNRHLWLYRDRALGLNRPPGGFFPTHPEGLLIELKKEFVSENFFWGQGNGAPQSEVSEYDREREFAARHACRLRLAPPGTEESTIAEQHPDLQYCSDEMLAKWTKRKHFLPSLHPSRSHPGDPDPLPVLLKPNVLFAQERNRVNPLLRHMMHRDLRNYGVFAVHDITWPRNVPERYRGGNQRYHPEVPLAWAASLGNGAEGRGGSTLPHVFEGGTPTGVPRICGWLEFRSANRFLLVASTAGRVSRTLLGRDDRTTRSSRSPSLAELQAEEELNARYEGNLASELRAWYGGLYATEEDAADTRRAVDVLPREDNSGVAAPSGPRGEAALTAREGKYLVSETEPQTVHLHFHRGTWRSVNETVLTLLFTGTAGKFTVMDGDMSLIGIPYLSHFKLLTQTNEEFVDENRDLVAAERRGRAARGAQAVQGDVVAANKTF